MAGAMPKRVKIRTAFLGDSKKVGIVASNLTEVRQKGHDKLELLQANWNCKYYRIYAGIIVYLESDGTIVEDDDYFQTLEDNTCLVLAGRSQTWTPTRGLNFYRGVIEQINNQLCAEDLNRNIDNFLDEEPSETMQVLMEFVYQQQGNIEAENRDEDPNWFEDMELRFRTKSQLMFFKAQERVRGYFSKTKEMLDTANYTNTAKTRRNEVIQSFKESLKRNTFHGAYFSRQSTHNDRLCNETGWFRCQGAYDAQRCERGHQINPYSTKDNMVLFSMWNLDHVIEKSRAVIPALDEAIQNCPNNKEVNVGYFYDHLFTRRNLKLVDIRCHKKTRHIGAMDRRRFYQNLGF